MPIVQTLNGKVQIIIGLNDLPYTLNVVVQYPDDWIFSGYLLKYLL
jgi:hypothetical protein